MNDIENIKGTKTEKIKKRFGNLALTKQNFFHFKSIIYKAIYLSNHAIGFQIFSITRKLYISKKH